MNDSFLRGFSFISKVRVTLTTLHEPFTDDVWLFWIGMLSAILMGGYCLWIINF